MQKKCRLPLSFTSGHPLPTLNTPILCSRPSRRRDLIPGSLMGNRIHNNYCRDEKSYICVILICSFCIATIYMIYMVAQKFWRCRPTEHITVRNHKLFTGMFPIYTVDHIKRNPPPSCEKKHILCQTEPRKSANSPQ